MTGSVRAVHFAATVMTILDMHSHNSGIVLRITSTQ